MTKIDWAGSSGDAWARRWRDTDRGLAPVGRALDQAIADLAPGEAFRALDIGCGPGTTALALARARPDSAILACDISGPLIAVARERAAGLANLEFVVADAEAAAAARGPFDLIYSRHGVMFFADPERAFAALRAAARPGAPLIFSCFADWAANPWAALLADAAAGETVPAPGREPGGFAFADPGYVRALLAAAGWRAVEGGAVDFDYVAGEGTGAEDEALDFFAEIGPASRILADIADRAAAIERMRAVIGDHAERGRVVFPGAAWIWTARA